MISLCYCISYFHWKLLTVMCEFANFSWSFLFAAQRDLLQPWNFIIASILSRSRFFRQLHGSLCQKPTRSTVKVKDYAWNFLVDWFYTKPFFGTHHTNDIPYCYRFWSENIEGNGKNRIQLIEIIYNFKFDRNVTDSTWPVTPVMSATLEFLDVTAFARKPSFCSQKGIVALFVRGSKFYSSHMDK